jgi:rare lipoprotein A
VGKRAEKIKEQCFYHTRTISLCLNWFLKRYTLFFGIVGLLKKHCILVCAKHFFMKRKFFIRNDAFKTAYCFLLLSFLFIGKVKAQKIESDNDQLVENSEQGAKRKPKTYYGIASFYADKFNGRQTANGDIYAHDKPSAACNVLPLGTWIRVTNLKNERSVIVRVNDRLHPRMKRIVDLNKDSAEKLGYAKKGLEEVKVEVLEVKKSKSNKIISMYK